MRQIMPFFISVVSILKFLTLPIQTPYIKMAKYPSCYWADINMQKSMKTSRKNLSTHILLPCAS